jgi:hypothetical protein
LSVPSKRWLIGLPATGLKPGVRTVVYLPPT